LETIGDFKHDDGKLYIISEFIPGNSFDLREVVKERSAGRSDGMAVLSAEELCDLTFQLINVLAVMHGRLAKKRPRKISHGDIRPENIVMVPKDGSNDPSVTLYKLTNFNLETLLPHYD